MLSKGEKSSNQSASTDRFSKRGGLFRNKFVQNIIYAGVTVFCCVAIIVFGITMLTKADPVTTSIGENIITNNLTVAGLLDVDGDSTLAGDVSVGGILDVTGNSLIGGTLDVTGEAAVGGDLDVTGNSTLDGTLGVTGDSTLSGDVNVGGDLTVSGSTSFGNASFSGIDNILYVDGVAYAQNSTGIQAAIDALPAAGGKVILPAATYNVATTITIRKSNVTLEGVGDASKLFLANSANDHVLEVGDGTNSYSNINITSLQIDGNRANNIWDSHYGILLDGHITNSRVEKCYVHDTVHSGIVVASSDSNIITNNVVKSAGSGGISISTSYHNVVSSNVIYGAGGIGINLWSGDYSVVSGNTVNDNGYLGISIYSSPNSTVTGNSVYSNSSTGIIIDRISNDTTVSGNVVSANTAEGILINRAMGVVVNGNTIKGNGTGSTKYNGVYIYSDNGSQLADRNIISNNNIYANGGATKYQINLEGSSTTYVNNNKISDNNISVGSTGAGTINDAGTNTQVVGNYTGDAGEGLFDVRGRSVLTALTIAQSGTGDIVDFKDGAVSVFKITDGGNVIMSGNLTTPSINNILYVDGTKYAQNSTGIQAAIDALPAGGGKVILPAGTYSITASVIIAKSNVTLEGVGEATNLYLANAANADVITVGDGTNPYSGIMISNLKIDGNQVNQTTNYHRTIWFNYSITYSTISNVYATNSKDYNIHIQSSNYNKILNNKITATSGTQSALWLSTGSSYNVISGNIVSGNNSSYAIYLANATGSEVVNNEIFSNTTGIYASSSNNNNISNNTLYLNNRMGIGLNLSSYNTIESNNLKDNSQTTTNTYDDITLQSTSTYNIISGNNISANLSKKTRYGINEAATVDDYNTISNNTIIGPVTGAINAQGAHTSVSGNKTSSATEGLFDIVANAGATQSALQVTQNGTGKIVSLNSGGVEKLSIDTQGDIYNAQFKKDVWSQLANTPDVVAHGNDLMAYAGRDYIYALRGYFTQDFYRYSISSNAWTSMASTPATIYTGSLTWTGGDYMYAFRGSSTTVFYRYSISGNSWTTMAAAPMGVYSGGSIEWTGGDYLYATVGDAQTGFYRYSISGNSWTAMTSVPDTVSNGGSLAFTGGDYLYLTRGNSTTDFYRYSISGNSWATLTPTLATFGYGGGLIYTGGDYLYASKGGGSLEFYRFSISANYWQDVTSAPAAFGRGGSIVYANGFIYGLLGSYSTNFYRYSLGSDSNFGAQNNNGLMLRGNVVAEGNITFASKITSGNAFTMSTTSTGTALTVVQSGTGDIVDFKDDNVSVFRITDGGNLVMSGNITASGIDGTLYVDGTKYTQDSAGIQNAIDDLPSTGGKVILPAATYNVDRAMDSTIAASAGGTVFVNETNNSNDAAANDMSLLPASPQTDDAYWFGFDYRTRKISLNVSTAGAGTWTIAWEYWNGSSWAVLSGVTDSTGGFTVAGTNDITYNLPTDWTKTGGSGGKFFIRARVSAFTSMATRPLGAQSFGYGSIYISNNNIQLFGVGKATIIKLINNYNADTYILRDSGHTGIVISDLAVDINEANQASGTNYGIYFASTTSSRIENCWISGAGWNRFGIDFAASKSIIRNCVFSGNNSNATSLHIVGNDNTITGNVFVSPGYGLYEQNVNNNVISNNSFNAVDLRLWNSTNNSIVGNKFNSTQIYLRGGSNNNTVTGNSVTGTTGNNVNLESSSYNAVSSNVLKNTTGTSVYINSTSTYNNVNGNDIQVTGSYGIAEAAAADDYNIIANNIISGATVAAISPQGPHSTLSGNKTSAATEGIFDIVANASATQTALSVSQNGTGKIVSLSSGGIEKLYINTQGDIYNAQFKKDVWARMTDVPGTVAHAQQMAAYTGGDYIYALRGGNPMDFYRYSISSNTWNSMAQTPSSSAGGSLTWTGGDYLYACAGGGIKLFWRYSISGNSWSAMTQLPNNGYGGTSLEYTGGDYIYLLQGYGYDTLQRYSISGNSWTAMASAPGAVNWGGDLAYAGGDYLYATRGNSTTDFYRYSISSNTWTSIASTPAAVSYGGALVHIGGDYIYAMKGGDTNNFSRYSIAANYWQAVTSIPAYAEVGGSLIYANNYIYALPGRGSAYFYRYSPGSDSNFGTQNNDGLMLRDNVVAEDSIEFASKIATGNAFTMSATSTGTALSVAQSGTGDIVDFKDGAASVFKITDGGNVIMSGNLTTSSINNTLYVDGTKYTQDSTGIQAAVNALPAGGGKVVLPAGTYNITATITIAKSNVTLEGVGDSTKLFLANNTNTDVIIVGDGATAYSNIDISKLKIDGNKANNTAGRGIYLNVNITNSNLSNLNVYDCKGRGIQISASTYISVKNSYVNSGGSDGIFADGSSYISVINNTLTGNAGQYSIMLWSTKYSLVEGNACNDSTSFGIVAYSGNSNNNVISGNYIKAGTGIAVGGAAFNNTITGNTIYSCTGYGIQLGFGSNGSGYNTISSNTLKNNTNAEIYIGGFTTSYNNIVGNNIQTTAAYGIREIDSTEDYNNITGNYVTGAATANISTAGVHTTVSGNKTSSATEGIFDIVANTGATQTALQVTQNGTGKIVSLSSGGLEKLYIDAKGDIYNAQFKKDVWSQMADAPGGIGHGSDLIAYTGGDYMYALRGAFQTDFYRYSISANSWATLAPAPGTIYNGSLTYTGGDYLYAFKGGGSDAFYRYSITNNIWEVMAWAPGWAYGGGALEYTGGDYIYATLGDGQNLFYRYSISGNNWTAMAPVLGTINWGGDLSYTGGDYIYATRGANTTNFYRYSISGNSWTSMAPTPVTIYYGGAILHTGGDYIYAMKGGNTANFYRYSVSANYWQAMTTMPTYNEVGGSLVYANGFIYAFAGNMAVSFYRYSPGSDSNFGAQNNNGLMLRGNVVAENPITFASNIVSGNAFTMMGSTSGTLLTVSQSGTGGLIDIVDTGVSIFNVGKATIAMTRPLDLQVEGDTGLEYNLNFLNTATSYINSAGPLTIMAGDSNAYENLTLTTGGTGDVIVDVSLSLYGFRMLGTGGKVFSVDPSGNVIIGGVDSNNADLTVKRNIATQGGNIFLNNLATPTGVTVTPVGTTGATSYGYRVSAINGNGETLAAATVTTATGNAALSASNYNRIVWNAVAGANGYKVYGRTGSSELYMATVNSPTLYYSDTGTATPSGALPTANTSGGNITYPSSSSGPIRTLILTPSGATIPSLNGAAQVKVDGTNYAYYVLDFDADAAQSAFWSWTMPNSYDGGTVNITYYWEAAATTGSAVWCFQSIGVPANSTQSIDSPLGAAVCATSAAPGSANYLTSVVQSNAVSNFAAGQYIAFKVYRDATNASDSMTGNARLVKVTVGYHVNNESD